jgi:hypothetical protein
MMAFQTSKYFGLHFAGAAVAAGVLLGFSAQSARAVTFNFASIADTLGEGTWNAKVGAGGYALGGLTVFASASNSGGNNSIVSLAYLDAGNAGLGVCSLAGSCAGTSDDNVGRSRDTSGTGLETLTLSFNQTVSISQLTFRNRDHGLFTGHLLINGVDANVTSGVLATSLSGSIFTFASEATVSPHTRDYYDFYLSGVSAGCGPNGGDCAPVPGTPLPGSIWLMSSAIAGGASFGAWRRRRTNKTSA